MRPFTTVKSSSLRAGFIGLFLFLVAGGCMEWAFYAYRQEQAASLKMKTLLQADIIRARIEGELNAVVFLCNALAGDLSVSRDPAETREMLSAVFLHSRHVRSFQVAVGYRLAYVFPQGAAAQAVGSDYRDEPNQWPLIQRSIETRSAFLEGPSSQEGLTYRKPIFLNGHYWGLLSAVVDNASLLLAAGLDRSSDEYQYALRSQDELGKNGEMVVGAAGLFDEADTEVTAIPVPGGAWKLAVKPLPAPTAGAGLVFFRGLGWLFAGLLAAQAIALVKLKRDLSDLALYDRLTGLPGRPLFLDRLKQMIRRTKRNQGRFSVLYVDLDGFKSINQQQGQKVGDMMLAGFGKRLIGSIRHCDTVTRWGGDEFLVLLDACPFDQAKIIAENLRHKIELPVVYGEQMLRIGASVGLATYPEDGRSLNVLLKTAEMRMDADKARRTRAS